jgi:S1-C subfamily serine protease
LTPSGREDIIMNATVATPREIGDERSATPAPPETPTRRGVLRSSAALVVLVSALVAAVIALPVALWAGNRAAAEHTQAPLVAQGDSGRNGSAAEIARAVGPSVALVDVTTAQGRAEGSAVIYRSDGYLITNNHVVEQANEVTVTLPDGTSAPARVVGTDPATDIAMLKIRETGLPAARLASTTPQVGDRVLAVGSPFGLAGTVTEGIISAAGRTVDTPNAPLTNMLQTDAAINPGNSGGALVDDQGQVVGINTAILSPSGTNDGIGFAIPIGYASNIADQLITHGSVQHGYLGVAGQTVDPQVAEAYELGIDHGALVVQVQPASPAASAGLRQGDIITALDGHAVTGMEDLAGALIRHQPGDRVELTIHHDGGQLRVHVTLAQAPQAR